MPAGARLVISFVELHTMNAVIEQQRPLWLEEVSTRWRELLDHKAI